MIAHRLLALRSVVQAVDTGAFEEAFWPNTELEHWSDLFEQYGDLLTRITRLEARVRHREIEDLNAGINRYPVPEEQRGAF